MNDRTTVMEEAEHMLSAGESPDSIARMLGVKVGSVSRSLLRAGRADLALIFERARRVTEAHPCIDCGAQVSDRQAPRCRSCGCRHREAMKRERGAA